MLPPFGNLVVLIVKFKKLGGYNNEITSLFKRLLKSFMSPQSEQSSWLIKNNHAGSNILISFSLKPL